MQARRYTTLVHFTRISPKTKAPINRPGLLFKLTFCVYPSRAAAPPTISVISVVIAA